MGGESSTFFLEGADSPMTFDADLAGFVVVTVKSLCNSISRHSSFWSFLSTLAGSLDPASSIPINSTSIASSPYDQISEEMHQRTEQ